MFYNSLRVALSNINNLRHFLPRSVSTSVGEVIDHNLPFFELLLLQGLTPFNCNKTSPGKARNMTLPRFFLSKCVVYKYK